MKREWIAAGLLLAMFSLSLLNIRVITGWSEEICTLTRRCAAEIRRENYTAAVEAWEQAHKLWQNKAHYAGAVLPHPGIDSADDCFYTLKELLLQQDIAALAACENLTGRLEKLQEMECLRLHTIFMFIYQ